MIVRAIQYAATSSTLVMTESEGFAVSITTLYDALESSIMEGQNNGKSLTMKPASSQATHIGSYFHL
jgi:hypothetical protein